MDISFGPNDNQPLPQSVTNLTSQLQADINSFVVLTKALDWDSEKVFRGLIASQKYLTTYIAMTFSESKEYLDVQILADMLVPTPAELRKAVETYRGLIDKELGEGK